MQTLRSNPKTRPTAVVLFLLAIILSAAFAPSMSAQAQQEGKSLLVQKKDGTKHYYLLANLPVITFADDKCSIKSSDFCAEYPMYEIDFARFVDSSAGIDEMKSEVAVDLSDPNRVRILGLAADSAVSLYNLSGVMLSSTKAFRQQSISFRQKKQPSKSTENEKSLILSSFYAHVCGHICPDLQAVSNEKQW